MSVEGDQLPLLVPARVCLGLRDLWDRFRSPGVVGCGSAVADGGLTDALVLACSPEPPKAELNRQETHFRLKEYWLNNDKVDPVITVTWCHTDLPRGWWGKRKDMMLLYFHSWMPDPAPFRFFTKSSFSLFHIALQVRTESKKRDRLPQQSPM